MPWQERDWAKWTDEERNRFLGTSVNRGGGSTTRPPAGGYRGNPRAGGSGWSRLRANRSVLNRPLGRSQTILALAAIAAIIGYGVHKASDGQSQRLVIPTPDLTSILRNPNPATNPAPAARVPAPEHRPMQLPSSLRRGTYLTSSGTLGTNVSGIVIVEGRWGSGPWYRLASANATNGVYRVRYLLDRPGLVHLRIALPDGNYVVGTVRIT